MKKWMLLALLVVSVEAHADWHAGYSEWINGRAHWLSTVLSTYPVESLNFICGPSARSIELRLTVRLPDALRNPHIAIRVDQGRAQPPDGVQVTTLEDGKRVMTALITIDEEWAQTYRTGQHLVIRYGYESRVPSGKWYLPDQWDEWSTTETVSLSGFTAAYTSLPERCTTRQSGLIPF